ncbi:MULTISPECIES: cyclic nucleotide-binding domain-containing protein [Thalassospira]|jgi:CRP-like cAMP-binding protein|uniref:Cyclic nucleotide-binding domain-containing protein n=1 Tax=Thalassospira povalilytica TaxID=732237 RepID=A0A8I1M5X6_9PROT|nr:MULTISPECIES: cyclic nucleotide-binding domain-containing protein [Thalassospira]MEE3047200.1 cyclic nucleotide-binding domain-containing protein [Pseudomonadota bacterium]RCK26624.1 cAMP-binding protein [Thalassospira profundimaris]MAL40933.1 cAMP-binding protein [Thalassospira sp.]MBN8195782.1 cyclic nucleotide-binding domain-containing protein [Thalassospira povalilytica]MBO6769877.1 cyclic nucleotide-binding domain-containing protein [Thalassospira sp.]|tara:strand:+ start:6481 stop:6900 length:420 start_codon:yes stop_codon:yes gene_type:complete
MGITDGNKKVMDRQVFAMDQVIFREGKPGNAAYVVQEGKVEVFKTLNGDEEVILGTIEAGGLFGELALVDNKPRMASARATERTVLIAINRQTFEKKMAGSDRFIKAILRILLGNYRTVVRRAALAEAKLKEHGIPIDN